MDKYELAAKVAKYTMIVTSVYLLGRFGINIYFDKGESRS